MALVPRALLLLAVAAVARARVAAEELEAKWFSQYGQDRYLYEHFFATTQADIEASAQFGHPGRQGVFVELGASDGLEKSNTLAFERLLGWKGLLIEPSRPLFQQLRRNRPGCTCVNECVAHVAGRYAFEEDGLNSGFMAYQSGGVGLEILGPQDNDHFRFCRTLPELIDEHLGRNAHIDYLSLDTEGSELDILRSFDFGRHTVDVITVEVHIWRERLRAQRLAMLLVDRGFRFVERLVDDEVWVRRRGTSPDPGCLLPVMGLARAAGRGGEAAGTPLPPGGWARARAVLREAAEVMAQLLDAGRSPSDALNGSPPSLRDSIWEVLQAFDQDGDPAAMEAQCPVGMLALALAAMLLRSRKHYEPATIESITRELRVGVAFHPIVRLQPILSRFRRDELVEKSEQEGKEFEVTFPLGRIWHETRFVDALESGWPIFGLLDTTARFLALGGHAFETVHFGKVDYRFPMKVPAVPCELELPPAGSEDFRVKLRVLKGRHKPRPSSQDLQLDADSCGLLAVAAARFHAARAAFASSRALEKEKVRYAAVANFTAVGCRKPRGNESVLALGTAARKLCAGAGLQACAAIDGSSRALSSRCLRLQPAPGASLQVRLPLVLADTRAGMLVEEGERLLREFVDRHGLYTALWAAASPRLAPPAGAAAGAGGGEGAEAEAPEEGARASSSDTPVIRAGNNGGETLFGVLHSIQRQGLGLPAEGSRGAARARGPARRAG